MLIRSQIPARVRIPSLSNARRHNIGDLSDDGECPAVFQNQCIGVLRVRATHEDEHQHKSQRVEEELPPSTPASSQAVYRNPWMHSRRPFSESDSAGKPRLVRLENLWPRNPVKPNSKSRGSTCQRWAGRQCAGINRSEVEDERALRERSSHPLGLKFGAGQAPIDARRSSNSGARAPRNSRLGPPRTTPTGAHPAAGASPRVKRTP